MKNLLLLLFIVLSTTFCTHAAKTWDITLDIEDASTISVKLIDSDNNVENLTVVNGENNWSRNITSSTDLVIESTDGYLLRYSKDGQSWSTAPAAGYVETLSSSAWSSGSLSLKIKTVKESDYRSNKVKINIDDPENVTLALKGQSPFTPTEKEFDLAYSPTDETTLTITPKSGVIYKVTADGENIEKGYSSYTVNLVDDVDNENPIFIQTVDIQVNFPADLKYTIKIGFTNNDPECVTSVTYDGIEITNFDNPDGFKVTPGKELVINLDTEHYDIDKYYKNGEEKYTWRSYISESPVISDLTYEITAINLSAGIDNISISEDQPADIYNLQGIKVKSQANTLNDLPSGIYIVNGRKIRR